MNKKKITTVVVLLAFLAVAVTGGTLAYFTDTHQQTNTFTSGKVGIALDEAVVEKDASGNLVDKGTRTTGTQDYRLYPAMTVYKDPTITVDSDSEDAYIAAKITITGDLLDLYGADIANPKTFYNLDINKFVSGGLIAPGATQEFGWNGLSMVYHTSEMTIYQDATNGNNGASSKWVMYIFMKDTYEAAEKIVLFDTITIDKAFDNEEMAKLNGMKVVVDAFAVQEYGFDSCFKAMTNAFPTQFDF